METDPVSKDSFFGRRELLSALEKRFQAFQSGYRQNVGMVGRPYTGKSSILAEFLRRREPKRVIPIVMRVEEVDSFKVFSQKWLGGILYGYERFLGLTPARDFQSLVKRMRRRLPLVLKKMRLVRKLAETKQYDESYRELLNLLPVLQEETGKKVLLVLDEFDRLVHLPLSDPYAQLGKEIMVQKDTMFVVTSSNPPLAREIFRDKLSLLFSNFEVLEVHNLSFGEAEQWMKSRLPDACHNRFLRRLIPLLTNGQPYYMNVLLTRLEELIQIRDQKEMTLALLIEVFDRELFDHRGVLHQHFMMNIFSVTRNRFSFAHGDVLLSIALGKKKVSYMTDYLGKSTEEIKKILHRLIREGFVIKRGSFYDLTDSLFRFWLREVYYRKRASFEIDFASHREQFRASLKTFFDFVADEDRKDLPLRIEELFKRFRNDIVELGMNRLKCPRFSEVNAKPSNGRMFPVLARNHNTRWLCQVVKDEAKEEDVRLFLDDLGRLRNRVQKKLMIVLRGMELNARLIAKDAKIQIWDLKDLNSLLDLYGQIKVIL